MSTFELILPIFSSSLIAGVVGALIGGWFMLRGKHNDYANEYYKIVLTRRVQAYEEVERLVSSVKTAVLGRDGRPYHLLFSTDDGKQGVYSLLFAVMSNALWLSDELFELTRQFNLLVYRHGDTEGGLIEFGKNHYRQIADLRTQIEKAHLRDMLTLHDVPGFLKSKKPTDSYGPVKVQN